MGYWWVELGGEADSIHETEEIRDELLQITYGVWDHIKNRCPNKEEAASWALDWIQFLPAKRESRRYVGAHVLSQNDIESGGRFDDTVAYGGWSMDDHHPSGFRSARIGVPATIFHEAPSPYGIPYRCLYSQNVENLLFAGRDASCTHAAMSSTRVMGTGCSMGQAVGTAAALAARWGVAPREVGERIEELQQILLDDDAYLPEIPLQMPDLTRRATLSASQGDPEYLRDGIGRPVGKEGHCWPGRPGDIVEYALDRIQHVESANLVLDTGLDRTVALSYHQPDDQLSHLPPQMPRALRVEIRDERGWHFLARIEENRARRVRIPVNRSVTGVRYVLEQTWGGETSELPSKLFGFWLE
jgi:hypothetical protein